MTSFKFLPFPELETHRLNLSRLSLKDENQLLELRGDERVVEFVERPKAKSLKDVRNFIEKINSGMADNKWVYWSISLKNDPDLIGTICLWNFNEEKTEGEIGYELHPDYQGQGIMQETVEEIIKFGFETLKLNLIRAFTHSKNRKSSQLLKRKGFVFQEKSGHFSLYILQNPDFRQNGI